jgi:hypothetical protein
MLDAWKSGTEKWFASCPPSQQPAPPFCFVFLEAVWVGRTAGMDEDVARYKSGRFALESIIGNLR